MARSSHPPTRTQPRGLGRRLRRLRSSLQNARELVEFGRLGPPWGLAYEVVEEGSHHRLRRYASVHSGAREETGTAPAVRGPVLLVPPLMLTSEIYDVAADISAVVALTRAGLDVWLVDFGAPERETGGLTRTLDDHVLAIDASVERVRAETGEDVHLVGYSQGGMFCYQAAAYRRGRGLRSLVTFGSPVDIHRALPALDADLGARVIGVARKVAERPLAHIEGLPGFLSSTGFKLLSLRKELAQVSEFFTQLHDREALVKRESRRRFLSGEGFVAWPGPALRTFVDEFVVANRMCAGGFVIAGRTVTLAELELPILCFVGERDDIARPAAVRAIRGAAPRAEVHEVGLAAGHFGLVVGSTAMRETWPTVIDWVRWRAEQGPRPSAVDRAVRGDDRDDELGRGFDEVEAFDIEANFEPVLDALGSLLGSMRDRLERTAGELGDTVDGFRYQLPRLRSLEALTADTRVSLGAELADRAAHHSDRTFFLWRGRAFSYADAERRVDAVVRGLLSRGVEAGQRVAVLMHGRPSYLSLVTALNRIGAVAVLLKPGGEGAASDRHARLRAALSAAEATALVADPPNAGDAVAAWSGPGTVWVLGGGPQRDSTRELVPGCFDLEGIDPARVELPAWYVPNPGRARDLAMVMVTVRPWSAPRTAAISNGRWAVSAYGAAATCLLSRRDTVYCALPLHHAAGMLTAVGGALVGRARLALAPVASIELEHGELFASRFWSGVRASGATVAFYAGEMCRLLVDAPPVPAEGNHPLRMLAGSGMRADLWQRVQARLGPVSVREFYASTEGNLVLANVTGKLGALGRPLPGSSEIAVVAYDFASNDFVRDAQGHARRCRDDEAGLLIARVDATHPGLAAPVSSPGGSRPAGTDAVARFYRGVFGPRDLWYSTGDLVRRDPAGDYWYVDRTSHLMRGPHGWIASRGVEDCLDAIAGVRLAVVYALERERVPSALRPDAAGAAGVPVVVATVVVDAPQAFDPGPLAQAVARLRPEQRPQLVRLRTSLALSDGYRPLKTPLIRAGVDPEDRDLLRWDPAAGRYLRVDGSARGAADRSIHEPGHGVVQGPAADLA